MQLTVTEFLLVKALATRPGMVKNRDQLIDAAYAEKREAPGVTWNRRIEAARQLRLEGIDADSEAIEARVRQIEANQAAQAAANQGGDPMQEPVPAAPPPGSNQTP